MEHQVYPQRMVSQALWPGLLATLVDLALSACGGEKQQESRPRPYRTPTGPLPEDEKALRPS